MKPKKLVPFLVCVIFSCNSSTQNAQQNNEPKKPDQKDACEICLIEEKITHCDMARAAGYATKKGDEYQDSLLTLMDSLNLALDKHVSDFRIGLDLKSDFFAIDSARNWCIYSYAFGTNLTPKIKDSIYLYLYDELYNGASGFTISFPNYLSNMQLRADEDGKTWYYNPKNRNEKIYTTDEVTWKKELLIEWEIWMVKMDSYIMRLTTKKFEDLEEAERYSLESQINIHYTKMRESKIN